MRTATPRLGERRLHVGELAEQLRLIRLEEPYFSQYYNATSPTYPKAGSGGYHSYPDAASYVVRQP